MKGKLFKKVLAASLALLIVSGSVPFQPLTDLFGDTAIATSANGNELPIVPAYSGNNKFYVTNNTDFVTVTWNGETVSNGQQLDDRYDVIMTANAPFSYKIGNSTSTAQKKSENVYRVDLHTVSDVTVDVYYPVVYHDNGIGKNRQINLEPDKFAQNDFFYYDKSIPEGTLKASKSGDIVSFELILDSQISVKMLKGEDGSEIALTKNGKVYSFEPESGKTYYLVRQHVEGTESNWEENETEPIPIGTPVIYSVKHNNSEGAEEDIELKASNFDKQTEGMYSDKSFSQGVIKNFCRDCSTATGLLMAEPGTDLTVYYMNGKKCTLTKLDNSNEYSDNYTFTMSQWDEVYVVKNHTQQSMTPITYIDADGSEQTVSDYTLVTSSDGNVEWSGTSVFSFCKTYAGFSSKSLTPSCFDSCSLTISTLYKRTILSEKAVSALNHRSIHNVIFISY